MLSFKNLGQLVAILPLCTAIDLIRCGNQNPSQALLHTVQSFAGSRKCIEAEPFFKPPQFNVNTYIHVVVPAEERKEETPVGLEPWDYLQNDG